jgi:L-asparaginase
LYNTGDGTILAGSPNGRLDNINYGGNPGSLTPETLIGNVSEVLDIAQIAVQNIGVNAGGSANAGPDRYLNISRDANLRLCSEGSDILGAVMIHGTNSLHDTVSLNLLITDQ